jgi:ABC-type transporter Mla MlaB component
MSPLDNDARASGVPVDSVAVAVTLVGTLDATTATNLLTAAEAALADGATRLEVDLCDITSFTTEGAAALVTCRDVCSGLADGLHYLTNDGPGREALLSAFDDNADTERPA